MDAPNASMSDAQLVAATRAGDPKVFEMLVRRYFRQVYAVAYVRLGQREAAEDVAQETFLRAYLHLQALDDPARFAPWVSRIARNLALDWHRRGQRLAEIIPALAEREGLAGIPDAQAEEGLTMMQTNEQRQAVQDAILRLPPEQGEIVLLHFSEELGVPEIARRLEVHPTTVRRQLKRAQASLREALVDVLRDSLATVRPTPRAVVGTVALLGVLAKLSGEAKAAAIGATGGAAWLASISSSGSVTAVGSKGLLWFARHIGSGLAAGGKVALCVKGLAAVAVVATLLVGGSHLLSTTGGTRAPQPLDNAGTRTEKQILAASPIAAPDLKPSAAAAAENLSNPAPAESSELATAGSERAGLLLADAGPKSETVAAAVSGAAASVAPLPAAPPAEAIAPVVSFEHARTVRFPEDRSLGRLKTRPRRPREGQDWYEEWQEYGQATGLVTVPARTDLGLWVSPEGAKDLSPLADLKPGDLQRLDISNLTLEGEQWRHAGRVRGLETLHIVRCNLGDDDVASFSPLASLNRLHLTECPALTNRGLEHLRALPGLESLSLRFAEKINDAGLEALAAVRGLKNLDLGYTAINGSGFRHLAKLPLERLELIGTRLTDDSMAFLGRLASLRELNLQQTPIGDEGLGHLAGLTAMERLELGGTLMRPGQPTITSPITDAGLCHLKGMTRIKTLQLMQLAKAGDAGLACLEGMKDLTFLSPPARTTDAGMEAIGRLSGLTHLQLQLSKVTGAGLRHLKGLHGLNLQAPPGMTDADVTEIAKLDLDSLWLQSSPAVTDAGIAELKGLKSLHGLLMSGLKVSPEAYSVVQELRELRNLTLEPARGLPRFVDGSSWVKYVEGLPNLEVLGLKFTDTQDPDMQHIQTLPRLHSLWIDGTGVTDAGLAMLKGCPSLEWIGARQTKITEAGAAQLPGANVTLAEGKMTKATASPGRSESQWQEYVRKFIETYRLDGSQQRTAHSILREVCDEAAQYRQVHEQDLAQLDVQLAAGGADVAALKQRREELNRPVHVGMFNRLKDRLEQIPTGDQRQMKP